MAVSGGSEGTTEGSTSGVVVVIPESNCEFAGKRVLVVADWMRSCCRRSDGRLATISYGSLHISDNRNAKLFVDGCEVVWFCWTAAVLEEDWKRFVGHWADWNWFAIRCMGWGLIKGGGGGKFLIVVSLESSAGFVVDREELVVWKYTFYFNDVYNWNGTSFESESFCKVAFVLCWVTPTLSLLLGPGTASSLTTFLDSAFATDSGVVWSFFSAFDFLELSVCCWVVLGARSGWERLRRARI